MREYSWDFLPVAARQLQEELTHKVCLEPLDLPRVKTVGGVDAAYRAGYVYAVAVILSFPELAVLNQASVARPVSFPYIPGLLAFREAPGILEALAQLSPLPDVLIIDGHGRAHPRRFGLASHLGVLLDMPSIGCAKSALVGVPEPPAEAAGSWGALCEAGEIVGAVLRTRRGVKPVIVSAGHHCDLSSAIDIVLACCRGFRYPEPLRKAHQLATQASLLGAG